MCLRGLDTVKLTGRIDDPIGSAGTASEGSVGAVDLTLRPITREGELLETVPGIIVTQHSGEGKANQYFVRGLNLDHGTDFQTRLEGMPVNLPTHGHGQGYTDLNFVIPELVDHLEYNLGVYHAEVGGNAVHSQIVHALGTEHTLRAPASNLVNAVVGYSLCSKTRLQVSVLNALNGRSDDIQHAYPSRLRGEVSDSVSDVHVHPVEPRQVRAVLEYGF